MMWMRLQGGEGRKCEPRTAVRYHSRLTASSCGSVGAHLAVIRMTPTAHLSAHPRTTPLVLQSLLLRSQQPRFLPPRAISSLVSRSLLVTGCLFKSVCATSVYCVSPHLCPWYPCQLVLQSPVGNEPLSTEIGCSLPQGHKPPFVIQTNTWMFETTFLTTCT